MNNFLNEFKAFAMKGNVIDLAVGVVIGVAFNAVVDSFVKDVIMQLIGAIFKQPDFGSIVISYNGLLLIKIGSFINAIVNFIIIAISVFVAVKAMNKLTKNKAAQTNIQA